jgi:hypothetical protein
MGEDGKQQKHHQPMPKEKRQTEMINSNRFNSFSGQQFSGWTGWDGTGL